LRCNVLEHFGQGLEIVSHEMWSKNVLFNQ